MPSCKLVPPHISRKLNDRRQPDDNSDIDSNQTKQVEMSRYFLTMLKVFRLLPHFFREICIQMHTNCQFLAIHLFKITPDSKRYLHTSWSRAAISQFLCNLLFISTFSASNSCNSRYLPALSAWSMRRMSSSDCFFN